MIKLSYLSALVAGWFLGFISPVAPFLVFVFFLVLSDFITGIIAAKKRGEKLQSSGFRKTVVKLLLYCIAILLAEGMTVVIFVPAGIPAHLTWLISSFICLTEFKSNLENISSVTNIKLWDAVSGIIQRKTGNNGK